MKRMLKVVAMVIAIPGAALASGTLQTGPAPSWVKPAQPPALTSGAGDGAIKLILQDQQYDLQPGLTTRYRENTFRIETAQGLEDGNVSINWNPDIETATVHKLIIRRGTQIINVLASQSFTVVRRESNLDNAELDGVLTATIQPEGLQVGDVVDFATSITQHDPALQNHVEEIVGGWNAIPVGHAHLMVRWPSAIKMRVRSTTGMPALKIDRQGIYSTVELSIDDLHPLPPPNHAPPRYERMRFAELSDFSSWSDLTALMAPLYARAAALKPNGPLAKEAAAIAAESNNPKTRAEAVLALVQNSVRYVFLGMNDGGLVPADAETTWRRRFGDCKGKTALLLALLKALGIQAEPVFVSSAEGDGLDERLPMVSLFDHVLVRAMIAGRPYWLDGTRTGDTDLDKIETPDFRFGLPLIAHADLVPMDAPLPSQPQTDTIIRIDASAGLSLPAPTHMERIFRGDEGVEANQNLSSDSPDILDRDLRDYWRKHYDFVSVKSVSVNFDPAKQEERLVMDGNATLDWSSGWYHAYEVGVGYDADFARDPGPNTDAPFAVDYPFYNRTSETIVLPTDSFKLYNGDPLNVTVAGIAYRRTVTQTGDRVSIEEDERSVAREFPAAEADVDQAKLRSLDNENVALGRDPNYRPTDQELAASPQAASAKMQELVQRGLDLMQHNNFVKAAADFTQAIALDPQSNPAFADRGLAYLSMKREANAKVDFEAALKIHPTDPAALRGKAMIADQRGAVAQAIVLYSESLKSDPSSIFAFLHCGLDYIKIGDGVHALEEFTRGIALAPRSDTLLADRGVAYFLLKRTAEAQTDFDAAMKINPVDAAALRGQGIIADERSASTLAISYYSKSLESDPNSLFALSSRGVDYYKIGDAVHAIDDYTHAISLDPTNDVILVNRGIAYELLKRPTDAHADFDAALKINPANLTALREEGVLADQRGALTQAINYYSASLKSNPNPVFALWHRARDYINLGEASQAIPDIDVALRQNQTLTVLYMMRANALSVLGRTGEALHEVAMLTSVNPKDPNAHVFAARIYARYGHQNEAMSEFDAALKIAPSSEVYITRSEARPPRDFAGRQADLDAAAKLQAKSFGLFAAQAALDDDRKIYPQAAAAWNASLALNPNNPYTLTGRGIDEQRLGQSTLAAKDFAAADALATKPEALNNICWEKAVAGIDLDHALAECQAAVSASMGQPSFEDSLGFVELRLGHLDQAEAAYTAALNREPKLPASLYGISIVEARLGQIGKSASNRKAAIALEPTIGDQFNMILRL